MNSKKLCLILSAVLVLGLGGCQKEQTELEEAETQEVSIPMILTVDPSTGNRNEEEVVEKFNQAYEGTYHVEVEWIMETEEEYRKNLKRLNVTDQLPAVITDLRMLPSFYQMMIEEGRIEDLRPYIEGDEEWKNMIEPSVLDAC
ncbi:MAG TPA: carbohydrate ABC transporter substrate-binding protein, partial [Candidatus Blautia ornithocaccae]|nr:carbohydrate ABC transporter substrate-binding protein [Candidatus Blautia pullistercoris]HJD36048.1 carbohydrate ABC transporter substrate-binding protein [Candidatus Blautia ornithocaccae]